MSNIIHGQQQGPFYPQVLMSEIESLARSGERGQSILEKSRKAIDLLRQTEGVDPQQLDRIETLLTHPQTLGDGLGELHHLIGNLSKKNALQDTWQPPNPAPLPITAGLSSRVESSLWRLAAMSHGFQFLQTQQRLQLQIRQQLQLPPFKVSVPKIYQDVSDMYHAARKRTYSKHGLHFTYAVVSRREFPAISKFASAGLTWRKKGMIFVMEDYFVDLKGNERRQFEELVAVHEYGELVLGNHHEASLLEFKVAQLDGYLDNYLALLQKRSTLKLRDVVLERMIPGLVASLKEKGVSLEYLTGEENEPEPVQGLASSEERAKQLAVSFAWPPHLVDQYKIEPGLKEGEDGAREDFHRYAISIAASQFTQGYFRLAADAAFKAVKKELEKEAPSVEEALFNGNFAFYKVFRFLVDEVRKKILDKNDFNDEEIAKYERETQEYLEPKITKLIRAFVPDTQIPQALDSLQSWELWTRTMKDHLSVVESEDKWLDFKSEEFTDPAWDEDESAAWIAKERRKLWKTVQQKSNSAPEQEAVAVLEDYVYQARKDKGIAAILGELEPLLSASLEGALRYEAASTELYVERLKGIILHRLGHYAAKPADRTILFSAIADQDLQNLIDRVIKKQLASAPTHIREALAKKVKNTALLDVQALRQKSDRAFSIYRFDDPVNEHVNRLISAYQTSTDSIFRRKVAAQMGRMILNRLPKNESGNFLFALQELVDQGFPEEIALHIINMGWGTNPPFTVDHSLIPYLAEQYGLSSQRQRALIHYEVLKTGFLEKYAALPIVLKALSNLAPSRWVGLPPGDADILKDAAGLERSRLESLSDLPALMAQTLSKGRETVLKDLEAEFSSQNISIETLDRFKQALQSTYSERLKMASEGFALSFSSEFPKTGIDQKNLWIKLFLDAARDWKTLTRTVENLPPAQRPDLMPLLRSLDLTKRLELITPLKEQGDPVNAALVEQWPNTIVDANWIAGLGAKTGEAYPFLVIIGQYEELARVSLGRSPEEIAAEDRLPNLSVFLDCGVPELERSAKAVQRYVKTGLDQYGTLSTMTKADYLAEIQEGTDAHLEAVERHYKAILENLDKKINPILGKYIPRHARDPKYVKTLRDEKADAIRHKTRIIAAISAELEPIILQRGEDPQIGGLHQLWRTQVREANKLLLQWARHAHKRSEFHEIHQLLTDNIRQRKAYEPVPNDHWSYRQAHVLDPTALVLLRCAIAFGIEFSNSSAAMEYVAKQLPGYQGKFRSLYAGPSESAEKHIHQFLTEHIPPDVSPPLTWPEEKPVEGSSNSWPPDAEARKIADGLERLDPVAYERFMGIKDKWFIQRYVSGFDFNLDALRWGLKAKNPLALKILTALKPYNHRVTRLLSKLDRQAKLTPSMNSTSHVETIHGGSSTSREPEIQQGPQASSPVNDPEEPSSWHGHVAHGIHPLTLGMRQYGLHQLPGNSQPVQSVSIQYGWSYSNGRSEALKIQPKTADLNFGTHRSLLRDSRAKRRTLSAKRVQQRRAPLKNRVNRTNMARIARRSRGFARMGMR